MTKMLGMNGDRFSHAGIENAMKKNLNKDILRARCVSPDYLLYVLVFRYKYVTAGSITLYSYSSDLAGCPRDEGN